MEIKRAGQSDHHIVPEASPPHCRKNSKQQTDRDTDQHLLDTKAGGYRKTVMNQLLYRLSRIDNRFSEPPLQIPFIVIT